MPKDAARKSKAVGRKRWGCSRSVWIFLGVCSAFGIACNWIGRLLVEKHPWMRSAQTSPREDPSWERVLRALYGPVAGGGAS